MAENCEPRLADAIGGRARPPIARYLDGPSAQRPRDDAHLHRGPDLQHARLKTRNTAPIISLEPKCDVQRPVPPRGLHAIRPSEPDGRQTRVAVVERETQVVGTNGPRTPSVRARDTEHRRRIAGPARFEIPQESLQRFVHAVECNDLVDALRGNEILGAQPVVSDLVKRVAKRIDIGSRNREAGGHLVSAEPLQVRCARKEGAVEIEARDTPTRPFAGVVAEGDENRRPRVSLYQP